MKAKKTWTKAEQRKHRKLWVEALRSGKYEQQTEGALRNARGYCCLGVLCQISKLVRVRKQDDGDYTYRSRACFPPPDVMAWVGLETENGEYQEREMSLAGLNDGGAPFDSIAKIIEKEPKGLFREGK